MNVPRKGRKLQRSWRVSRCQYPDVKGIYLFKTYVSANASMMAVSWCQGFWGSGIIPLAAEEYQVQKYLVNSYWEDMGTLRGTLVPGQDQFQSLIWGGCYLIQGVVSRRGRWHQFPWTFAEELPSLINSETSLVSWIVAYSCHYQLYSSLASWLSTSPKSQ